MRTGELGDLELVHALAAQVFVRLGRSNDARQCAVAAVSAAKERGFYRCLLPATLSRGWAQLADGKTAEGIALLRNAVEASRDVLPSLLATALFALAAAYRFAEQFELAEQHLCELDELRATSSAAIGR
jgi:hypothetical protein